MQKHTTQWLAALGFLAVIGGTGCDDSATPGGLAIPADASVTLTDVQPERDSTAAGPERDVRIERDEEPPEPLPPEVEACTELFPPLCNKVIECVVGDAISDFLSPACDALIEGGSDLLVAGCEQLTGALPGGEGLGGLIVDFLFPVIEECIEDFACTPENIAYFASTLGDLFGAFGGGGGDGGGFGDGFDFSSIGNLIDLFSDCDEPPEPEEPDLPGPPPFGGSDTTGPEETDVNESDGQDAGPTDADIPEPTDATDEDAPEEPLPQDGVDSPEDASVPEDSSEADVPPSDTTDSDV